MVTDLIGGQVDWGTAALPSVQQHIKSGALRAIGERHARSASPPRPTSRRWPSRACPTTWSKAGSPSSARKGLPPADVKRLHDAVSAAFASAEVKEAMAKQGNTINVSTPEARGAVLPQRDGEVRQAREEGRDRAAVTLLRFRPRGAVPERRPGARARAARRRSDSRSRRPAPLRDDVSTDEITPLPILSHYDDELGRYPYTGFKAGDELPIGADAIRAGGIEVVVAGKRYGKGSSREHSPAAEKLGRRAAGHRRELRAHLPPERRQHRPVHLHRLRADRAHRAGEAIALDELVAGRDALAAAHPAERRPAALRPGTLRAAPRRRRAPPTPAPRTLFEKIVARHALATAGHAGRPGARAKAPSCAPTGASSTSTTPACAPTCCTQLRRRAARCTSRDASSSSRTTPPT